MQLNLPTYRRENGQTMAEYAVVLGLLVLGVVATIGVLSNSIAMRFTGIASIIKTIAP